MQAYCICLCKQIAFMLGFLKQHDYKSELKGFNLKATPARITVMRFLESTNRPVDVNAILTYLEQKNVSVDPATIFRMMNNFLQKGIVKEIRIEKGKSSYELANKKDHHHLVCERCGRIEPVLDNTIPQMEKEIGKKHGFLVKRHQLEFFGICKNCQS